MVTHRNFEILFGISLVIGAFALLVLALKISNFGGTDEQYFELTARFENIGDTRYEAIPDAVFVRNALSQRDHQVP